MQNTSTPSGNEKVLHCYWHLVLVYFAGNCITLLNDPIEGHQTMIHTYPHQRQRLLSSP